VMTFTRDLQAFRQALAKVESGGNEFTLPALDWSLDFEWRKPCTRVVVLFTDEPLETGHDPVRQRSKLSELQAKIRDLRVMVFFVGPACPEYESFNAQPRCVFQPIERHSDFFTIGFDKVLERIGKTVSASLGQQVAPGTSPARDLYGLTGTIRVVDLAR
jgi:hypothetical protein